EQSGAGNPRRKAHIIFYTARGSGLAADRSVLHNQGAQTFGSRIYSGGHPTGSAADNQYVKYLVVPEIKIEAEQPRDLVRGRFSHNDIATEDNAGYARSDRAATGEGFGFRISQWQGDIR